MNYQPLDLRTQLHQMVINDLPGPAGGENEELDEDSMRSRYIVRLLARRGQPVPGRTVLERLLKLNHAVGRF